MYTNGVPAQPKTHSRDYLNPLASCCQACADLPPPTPSAPQLPNFMGGTPRLANQPAIHSASMSSTVRLASSQPCGVNTVYLHKAVLALLQDPYSPAASIPGQHDTHISLLVADLGATNHMLPDKTAFVSYRPVEGRRVHMGNNTFAPIRAMVRPSSL